MEFTSSVKIDPEDMAIDMADQLSQDRIIDFIQFLDMQIADWDFTEEMYKFFKAQHKIYKKELNL